VHIKLVGGDTKRARVGVKRGGPDQLAGLATTLSFMPLLITQTIFHGLFERFPKLTFVGAEAGAGWVPCLLGEMDDRYRRNRFWTEVSLGMLPSEYFKRNWKLGIVRTPTVSRTARRWASRASCGRATSRTTSTTGPTRAT